MEIAEDTAIVGTEKRVQVLSAAREIISAQAYCALVTHGLDGFPSVRTMNPFPPEADLTVWMATNSRSRKVREIRADPHVCLYYADHKNAIGSVMLAGIAELVDDPAEKQQRKRAYWDEAFPDWSFLLLIKVVPCRLELLNYRQNFNNAPVTWRMPFMEL